MPSDLLYHLCKFNNKKLLSVAVLLLYCIFIIRDLKCFHCCLWRSFKEVFLFFSLLLVHSTLSAQDKIVPVIAGVVINQEQKPVDGSAVCLLTAADSSVVKIEICDKQGRFHFTNLKDGKYLLRVTSVGYQHLFYGPFDVSQRNRSFNAGKLQLTPASTTLKEVSIVEQKSFIELKPGKVVLNIENSILSASNSAFDILQAAPGVQMDVDERIRLNGKQNVLVLVNGKQTFMEGQALNDILKSMQGAEIDQIELINNPSAKFEATGSGSIINIKTKKNKQFGANGSFNANSGISLINEDNDPNFRVGSGLNINFRNKFISVFGNYTYGDVNQDRDIVVERDINNSLLTAIDVNYQSLTRRLANSYRAGVDIDLTSNHVMGVMMSGSDNRLEISKINHSTIFNQNILDSTIQTHSDQTRGLNNIVFNFNYKGRLGKKAGDVSFDWDYISYRRSSTELLTNNFLDASNNAYRESLLLRNSSPSEYDVQSVKIDYNVSLTKRAKLELGVQRSHVKGDSRLDFGRMRSDVYYPEKSFTNHFLIDEQISAGYVNYSIDFKKSNLAIGVRAEKTLSNGTSLTSGHVTKRDYLNFFPNLQFSQDLNDNNKILFSYSRRVTRPGYDNLNPFVAYLDQYSYRAGNPYLKPEFTRIAEITHVYKSRFSATLRTKIIDDLMLELNEQNDLTHVNTIISRNIDRQFMYGLELNAPISLSHWWDMNLNLQSMYEKYTTQSTAGEYENTSPSFVLSALQSLNFKNDFSVEINGKYESPTIYGIYNYKAAYTVDAAVAKSFFDQNATVRLRVSDLFNTSINRYTSTYQGLNLLSVDKRDSMLGQISFVYLFGRRTVKGARKRDTGSEKEQERIGS